MESDVLALLAAEACDDRKAVDIRMIRVDEVSSLADWFVICSGLSDVQVRAIARSVEDRLETEAGRLPRGKEGQREGHWVLLDYGELIVHVLGARDRQYYDLEAFWGHGEQVPFVGSGLPLPADPLPSRPHGSGLSAIALSGADEPAAP
jgi:ribosome-associated protein